MRHEYSEEGWVRGGGEVDPKDAATALRDIAEKLSPDRERRALEIAAHLGRWAMGAARRTGAECRAGLRDVLDALLSFSEWDAGEPAQGFNALQGCVEDAMRATISKQAAAMLQAAREFFEQAEEEAQND